jgi:hypothetical protein
MNSAGDDPVRVPATAPGEGAERSSGQQRYPWLDCVFLMVIGVLARVPLVRLGDRLLDSDLAVDGLTVLDLLSGRWWWHFPGTPALGIPHAWPAVAWAWRGVDTATLLLGGLTSSVLLIMVLHGLLWSLFRHRFGSFSGVLPVAIPNAGVMWLGARLTGGHLLTVVWFAAAVWVALTVMRRRSVPRQALFGLWCGLGIWLDPLAVVGLLGLLPAVVFAARGEKGWLFRLRSVLVWACCFGIGMLPRFAGQYLDPHDAYSGQDRTILTPREGKRQVDWKLARDLAAEHSRILGLECLPRLFLGRKLPGLDFDPSAGSLSGRKQAGGPRGAVDGLTFLTLVCSTIGLVCAVIGLLSLGNDRVRRGVALASWLTCWLTIFGFILHLNIFDSDNYRYLVLLLVPWAVGLAACAVRIAGIGGAAGKIGARLLLAILVVPGIDTARWVLDYLPRVLAASTARDLEQYRSMLVDALMKGPPEARSATGYHPIRSVYGNYWDVYRISFLTKGKLIGMPYPVYPRRFLDRELEAYKDPGRYLFARSDDPFGPYYANQAVREGARPAWRGDGVILLDWPAPGPGR